MMGRGALKPRSVPSLGEDRRTRSALRMMKPYRIKPNSIVVKLYPELARFRSDLERGDAYSWSTSAVFVKPLMLGLLSVLMIGLFLGVYLARSLSQRAEWYDAVSFALPAALLVVSYLASRKPIRCQLRRQLLQRGIPVCIDCGYDLSGNVSGRCPECGKPFKLSDWYMPPSRIVPPL